MPTEHAPYQDPGMYRTTMIRGLLLLGCILAPGVTRGEDWPCWRGPRGDGSSLEKQVPTHWDGSSGKNITWKVEIPGEGYSSPIVWGEHIFLTSCLTETEERILICLDRSTSRQLWQKTVVRAPLETKNSLNSYASGTPATDGRLVYVAFLETDGSTEMSRNTSRPRPITAGQIVVAAYDFEGQLAWRVKPGKFASCHGFCSCPVLYKDLVIVNGDHDGDSYIVAISSATGETAWKVPRLHKTRSYVTPIIREIDGQAQMVLSGTHHVASFDPADGKLLWQVDGPTEQFVASLVYDGSLFYLTAGFPTYHVMGIRPDGSGNVTDTHVAWHVEDAKCYVPSPVVIDGYLYVADDRGTVNCYRATTGERFWKERMGKHYSASLVTADGLVYLLADEGVMKLVRPGPQLEVVAENDLGEFCYASPAISDGQIFLRSVKHLFRIEQQAGDE